MRFLIRHQKLTTSRKTQTQNYLKKDTDADTSAYDRLLNVLKKLDTSYNPKMQKIQDPVIERNYQVTGDT